LLCFVLWDFTLLWSISTVLMFLHLFSLMLLPSLLINVKSFNLRVIVTSFSNYCLLKLCIVKMLPPNRFPSVGIPPWKYSSLLYHYQRFSYTLLLNWCKLKNKLIVFYRHLRFNLAMISMRWFLWQKAKFGKLDYFF